MKVGGGESKWGVAWSSSYLLERRLDRAESSCWYAVPMAAHGMEVGWEGAKVCG